MLAAAFPAFTRRGEGSSPSDPTDVIHDNASVVQRPGFRFRNATTRVRVPPDALDLRTDIHVRAHDVAAACRLAMADVRVRLPLGALSGSTALPRREGLSEGFSLPDLYLPACRREFEM